MKPENTADFSQQVAAWTTEAASGAISWIEFAERVLAAQLSSEGGVMADRDRQRRCRFPEVIFGQSKTAEQIETAARRLLLDAEEILVTRVGAEVVAQVAAGFEHHFYHPRARTLRLATRPIQNERNFTFSSENKAAPELAEGLWEPVVGVLAAGTTDIAIAEEAAQTLAWMGFQSFQVIDCGVAGPFRLLAKLDWIRRADVIVVVAGMEGALASVAGGLVSVPVIAVPTSIGYGANLQGITTMLSMLSSCAAGVTTVNIDGGFKGGYVAGLMCQRMKERGS
jgi:NCAIR mutase (PurE)-related protein